MDFIFYKLFNWSVGIIRLQFSLFYPDVKHSKANMSSIKHILQIVQNVDKLQNSSNLLHFVSVEIL